MGDRPPFFLSPWQSFPLGQLPNSKFNFLEMLYFVITMKFLRKKNIEHFNRSSRVVDLFLLYGSGSSISKNFRIRILRFRVSHFQKNLKSSFIFSISSF